MLSTQYYFIMQNMPKICHTVSVKSQQQWQLFRKREEEPIAGTPVVTLGKYQNHYAVVWTQQLIKHSLVHLKELSSKEESFEYAAGIVEACLRLAPVYGYFMINQNMIFMNENKEVFVWINPNILENTVKIYLPPTPDGEKTMIRSIVSFLKLWLRCDYNLMMQVNHLTELQPRLQMLKNRPFEAFKPKMSVEFAANRSSSVNIQPARARRRFEGAKVVVPGKEHENTSVKMVHLSSSPDYEHKKGGYLHNTFMSSNRQSVSESLRQKLKKKTTLVSTKQAELSDQSQQSTINQTTLPTQVKTTVNKSLGMNSYFPNKTTSNKNHIVQMILDKEGDTSGFVQNNIVLDEDKQRQMQADKKRRLKESLNGIGEEINDLFQSSFLEEDQLDLNSMSREFQNLLE